MKRYHYRSLLVCTLLCCAFLLPAQLCAMPGKGQPAPNFKVVTTSGQTVTLDNYPGYVLVLDFFAVWCIPCRTSVPHIVEVNRKYGKQGLQVLGMSADDEGDSGLKSFADQYGVNYPLARSGEAVQKDFGVFSVPVMFIIDKKGKVAEVYRGFNDEIGRSMEQLIKKLLLEK